MSMFARTPVYRSGAGGTLRFGLRRRVILPHESDVYYEVPSAAVRRLWLVSELFYGVSDLWWVLAEVNNVRDPLLSVPAGTRLRIPLRTRLAEEGALDD